MILCRQHSHVNVTTLIHSRDGGLPDRGLFGKINSRTQTPVNAVWLVIFLSILMGSIYWASLIAVYAIFSMCAVALDLSYVIPVICRRWFADHPEVQFKPGPFYMRKWGVYVNAIMVVWTGESFAFVTLILHESLSIAEMLILSIYALTAFEVTILCFPTVMPLTAQNMNYAAPITIGVMVLSLIWYFAGARRHYSGPRSNLGETHARPEGRVTAEELSRGSSEEDVNKGRM